MKENPLIELLKDAKNQSIVAPILEGCQKLNEVLAEAQRLERPRKYMDELRNEGIRKINLQLFTSTFERTTEINDHFDQLEVDWTVEAEKGISRRSMNLELEKTRYEAMSRDELSVELENVATGKYEGTDPIIVDALFATARNSRVKGIAPYRKLAIDGDYRRPWLANDDCKSMKTELIAYGQIQTGNIPVIGPDGGLASVALNDFVDGEE